MWHTKYLRVRCYILLTKIRVLSHTKPLRRLKNVIDYFVLLDQGASKNRKIIVPQSISAEANN